MFKKQNTMQHNKKQIYEKREKKIKKPENTKHALTTAGNSALHYEFWFSFLLRHSLLFTNFVMV